MGLNWIAAVAAVALGLVTALPAHASDFVATPAAASR